MTHSNLILTLLKRSFLLLLPLTFLVSCSEDEDPPTPVDEDVVFQIDLIKMAALEIKEAEGDNLEVFGNITTKLIRDNITETNDLWTAAIEEAIAVGRSDTPVMASVSYTVATSNIAASRLEVTADLMESDGASGTNAPEDLGSDKITTSLADITTSAEYSIVLTDSSGQHVQVTYSITRQ